MAVFTKGYAWATTAQAAKVLTETYVAGGQMRLDSACHLKLSIIAGGAATTSTQIQFEQSPDEGTTWYTVEFKKAITNNAVPIIANVFNLPGANGNYTVSHTFQVGDLVRVKLKRTGGDGTSTALVYAEASTPIPFDPSVGVAAAAPNASNVELDSVGSPTFNNVQDGIKVIHFAGIVAGGTITASGTLYNIAAGSGWIRESNADDGTLQAITWTASTGMSLSDGQIRYPGVEWSGSDAVLVIKTADTWDYDTEFPLGSVVREGDTLHVLNNPHKAGNAGKWIQERFYETERFKYAAGIGGVILTDLGSRDISISTGEFYDRLNEFDFDTFNTTSADTFAIYTGSTLVNSAATTWSDYYSSSGVLTALTTNQYANLWVYAEMDSGVVALYGTDQYATAAGAENEGAPATVPARVTSHAKLIGRIIFREGTAAPVEVQSAFTSVFTPSITTDHGSLAGLSDDDHPQYAGLGQSVYFGSITANGNMKFTAAAITMSMIDNNAAALTFGVPGLADMMVFVTSNSNEKITMNTNLEVSDNLTVGGATINFGNLPRGSTQVAAGVNAGELWITSDHATDSDNTVKIGV